MEKFKQYKIIKVEKGEKRSIIDPIAAEEEWKINLNGDPWKYLFISPGEEETLIAGHLYFAELIDSYSEIYRIDVNKKSLFIDVFLKKNIKSSSEPLLSKIKKYASLSSSIFMTYEQIQHLHNKLSKAGEIFSLTGGTHCCLILSSEGEILSQGEDISRHNAFARAVGRLIKDTDTVQGPMVILSSRINGEMVYRALRIGTEILIGVSAPTSFAVDLCKKKNITLIGFLREGRFNIYTAPHRVVQTL